MIDAKPIDVEVESKAGTALPVAIREADTPLQTPAQARVEAVANVLHNAYERASTLKLTPEEIAALEADFPDDAFKPGASGKEHLIYIEHAFLRERLNKVLGLGQWSIITRRTWGEDFEFRNNKGENVTGTRIYVEAVLLVRGCFVAEAIGDMDYFKKNQSTNYGDAVEGAKSAALRRCAKELGVGLQAWKKDFCEAWKARKHGKQPASPPQTAQKPPAKAPQANGGGADTPGFADRCKAKFLKAMDGPMGPYAWGWAVNNGVIMDTEVLADGEAAKFPQSLQDFEKATTAMETIRKTWTNHQQEVYEKAVLLHEAESAKKPTKTETGFEIKPKKEQEPWRMMPVPFGQDAGKLMGDLDKKKLWGWWANFKVETEYKGKPKNPSTIARDQQFRAMLDAAGAHYEFTPPEDVEKEGELF